MAGYTPLFNSIVMSSIWSEDDKTRIVWITMLASSDSKGIVEATVDGLAHTARVSIKDCENALIKLSSPDKYSRNKENDGRRIKEVPGGWMLLNYVKFREKAKERTAEYWREYRQRRKQNGDPIRHETYHKSQHKSQQNATNHNEITPTHTQTQTHTIRETKRNSSNLNLNEIASNAPKETNDIKKSFISIKNFKSSSSFRFDFDNILRKIILPVSRSDITAFRNLSQWAWENDNAEKIFEIARDSLKGKKPIALFFKLLDERLGYRPSAEKSKKEYR